MSSAGNSFDPAEILFATTAEDIATVRELFREYAANLSIDLCFQNFDQELAGLPGSYSLPQGGLFIARVGHQTSGCIALRPMAEGIGEIKRLYVRPEFRRHGLGRILIQRALTQARQAGYQAVRLDTLRSMSAAIALYTGFGFKEVAPYRQDEPSGICYFELQLNRN